MDEKWKRKKETLALITASKYRCSAAQQGRTKSIILYRNPLAATILTMHDLGAQPQGGRKTRVPGDKPSKSDRDGQISTHMRTPGNNPES